MIFETSNRALPRWLFCLASVSAMSTGCSSHQAEADEQVTQRASVLNFSAGDIARRALADTPDPDFAAARVRVERRVPAERVSYARSYTLGAGRAPISSDPTFALVRVDAATALGTKIDPVIAADPSSAGPALDALLDEILKLGPTAVSCADLAAPKSDACAFALIIIDVLRSEARSDAGTQDGSTGPSARADGGLGDASSDTGQDASIKVQISNVGASCTAASDCLGGAAVTCQAASTLTNAQNPGGSCTAPCTSSAECGNHGSCPLGELLATVGPIAAPGTVGYCSQECSLGAPTSCRPGYSCETINSLQLLMGGAPIPITFADKRFCVALPDSIDGGVSHDAGTVADAAGIDSGS